MSKVFHSFWKPFNQFNLLNTFPRVTQYSETASNISEYLLGNDFDTKKPKAKSPRKVSESFVCELTYSQ